jgi:uncharacterized protein (TIGR03437 family)
MRPLLSRLINRMTITALAIIVLITFIIFSHLTDSTGVSSRIMGRAAAQSTGTVVSVNGASYTAPIARGSFAILRGTNMAVRTEIAGGAPYPTQLAGTTVQLTDANNNQFMAPLIYASSVQINYMVPDQVALGTMNITVTSEDGRVQTGSVQIVNSAPALFTVNATGQGIPIGSTTFEGSVYTPLNNPDGSPTQIDPGTPWKRNILVLYGTGVTYASNVSLRINNVDYPVVYYGPDGQGRAGWNQMNILLRGTGIPVGTATASLIADGQVSNSVQLTFSGSITSSPNLLSLNDVQTIIGQCVQRARQIGVPGTCAITDTEGNVLAVFAMNGANPMTTITAFKPLDQGLEGLSVPSMLAAVSKAGTAAFFSTRGSGITTRTASYIIQEHFPVGVARQESGPLFGVQFSQLPCSDVRAATLPLGLSGDLGAVPIYKQGPNGPIAVGGIGFEANGTYTIDIITNDLNDNFEEDVAVAATFGFETPAPLRIDTIRVNGITLPYTAYPQRGGPAPPVNVPGDGQFLLAPRAAPPSRYMLMTIGGVAAKVDPRFFPPIASTVPGPNQLTAADVMQILIQALQGAVQMRAAILNPSPTAVQINATVVDTNGAVLGIASNVAAPEFGFDVSAQKARTANLFSSPNAAQVLLQAAATDNNPNIAAHVNAALAFGFPLNGAFMISSRGMGFASRPFFPDGQDGNANGPFSRPFNVFSPFNNGLQLQLVLRDLQAALGTPPDPSIPCTAIPNMVNGIPSTANGLQIFPGSSVLFKNGIRVGAVGISGDGVDQDDLVSAAGARGFEAPLNLNSSNIIIQGVRLPYLRYPAFPCINNSGCTLPTPNPPSSTTNPNF